MSSDQMDQSLPDYEIYQEAAVTALRTAQCVPTVSRPPPDDSPVNASFDVATRVKATPSSLDSPLEGSGFEPSVPRDTTKVSRGSHIGAA